MSRAPARTDRHRLRREWVQLLLALALVALLLGLERAGDRQRTDELERARLGAAVAAVEANLVQQMSVTRVALQGLADSAAASDMADLDELGPKLRLLVDVMPGVRTLSITDARGRVLASSRPEIVGMDFSARRDMRTVVDGLAPGAMFVSPPFRTVAGVMGLNLAIPVTGADGRPRGVVAATLDASYFSTLLRSELYAPRMWGAVAHGNGQALLFVPEGVQPEGRDLREVAPLFAPFLEAGPLAVVAEGPMADGGEPRLVALRTVRPASLALTAPLVLVLSRPRADIVSGWWRLAAGSAALWSLLAVASALVLRRLQRQDRESIERARERERERELDAERLQLALAGADLALWDLDLVGGRCTVNPRWFAMIGEPDGGVPTDADSWYARIHPDDRDGVRAQALAHQAGTVSHYAARYRVRHAQGDWIWLLDQGRVVERDAGGRALRMVGTHMDITASRRAEDALRASEQASRGLLDALQAGVVRHGPDTAVRAANPAACRILGLSLAQMLGRDALHPEWRFVEPDGGPMPPERYPVNRVRAAGHALEGMVGGIAHPGRDEITWVLVNAFPARADDGAIEEIVVTFVDITELHRAQQRLRLLEAAVERLGDVVLITEAEPLHEPGPRIVFVNPAFERTTGFRAEEAIGRTPRMLQGPQTDRAELDRIGRALAAGQAVRSELVNVHRNGQPYWIELDIVPLRDAAGRLTHFVGVQRDVSARKESEVRLRAAQQDLAATLDAVPDLLFEIDANGVIRSHHSPRRDLLLVGPERFLGRHVSDVLPAPAAAVVVEALAEALRDGFSEGRQYELGLPDGPRGFELSVARKPMPDGQVPRLIVLARDITDRQRAEAERRELERRLAAAQKLESLSTLAGGIAHEFNNLVPAILGNVAMARNDVPPEHPAQQALAQIQLAAQRARSMVQQILDFSRSRPPQLTVQPLRPVIAETLALLRSTLPSTVRLLPPDEPAPGEPPLALRADATQLQQVLMNLCINAWQALPDGRGRIAVGLAAGPPPPQPLPGPAPDGVLHLWVQDDGCGMDAVTLRRIFEPFFTTKPVGQGTGLGLSVVQALVASHGGLIDVQSEPGGGTTFHLWFPRVGDVAAAAEPAASAPATAPGDVDGAGRHVVYIDDDEVMRVMVLRLLQRLGYRVTVFESAGEALRQLAPGGLPVDVVVTDFNMPELSGLEVVERLAALRPGLPVVLSTGHVTPAIEAGARRLGVRGLLRKELTFEEIGPLLRRVLGDAVA